MNLINNPSYTPNVLIDFVLDQQKLKNDAALARALKVAPPVISKVRSYRLPIGDSLLVKMHELTELPTKELKLKMGIGAP